eukprot:GHVU01205441.1.p1 GENE.GHVU01205441.1~~GHVU01205441.1.p1  ORF type:complete len:155 (-),score=7.61 GHVU01205441.1:633-1097(-)
MKFPVTLTLLCVFATRVLPMSNTPPSDLSPQNRGGCGQVTLTQAWGRGESRKRTALAAEDSDDESLSPPTVRGYVSCVNVDTCVMFCCHMQEMARSPNRRTSSMHRTLNVTFYQQPADSDAAAAEQVWARIDSFNGYTIITLLTALPYHCTAFM